MNKKDYLVIGGTIMLFTIVITIILLTKNNNTNWITNVLNAQSYEMTIKDCHGYEKELDNNTLNEISNKWSQLSNNGPWTGDTSICYPTLTINYENNNIISNYKIIIIDDNTLVLDENTNTTYYTNAQEIVDYLNSSFIEF